ncbi:MAG: hypothetical protein ACREXS_19180 [Gammaproteobacteria bacterium]
MSDAEKIIWGAFGAVGVYVLGQLLSKFFIDPLYELRKTIGEVRFNLSFHSPTINTPIGRSKETSDAASDALRKSSSDLIAKLDSVPLYVAVRILSFGTFPPRKDIEAAAVQLRALSTYVHEDGANANAQLDVIRKRIEKIKHLLRLRPLEEEK